MINFKINDWVVGKPNTNFKNAKGFVYKVDGDKIYLKDKYGNKEKKSFSSYKFKKGKAPTDIKENINENSLRQMIRDAIEDIMNSDPEEIEEMSSVGGQGGGDGYQTPAAFVGTQGKKRKRNWVDNVNKIIGYERLGDEPDATELGDDSKKTRSVVMKMTEGKNYTINESNGHEIELFWKGLKGNDAKIGKFVVSPKTYDNIDTLFSDHVSIDLYDDEVSGKQIAFKDIVNKMKKTKYGKISMKEIGIHEGRRGSYQNYRDDNDKTPQQKIGESIQRMRRSLKELNKEVDLNLRLKTESGIEMKSYWKRTKSDLNKLTEHIHKLLEKIRRF